MNAIVIGLLLAIGWVAATGSLTIPNLILGALVGAAGLWLVRDRVRTGQVVSRAWRIASLAWLFLVELIVSAVKVAVLVLRPDMREHLRPGIVAFPLSLTGDSQITLLANMITLTPGTLSVDVSDDRKVLYVHAISVRDRDALIRDIAGGFEKKIAEAFP